MLSRAPRVPLAVLGVGLAWRVLLLLRVGEIFWAPNLPNFFALVTATALPRCNLVAAYLVLGRGSSPRDMESTTTAVENAADQLLDDLDLQRQIVKERRGRKQLLGRAVVRAREVLNRMRRGQQAVHSQKCAPPLQPPLWTHLISRHVPRAQMPSQLEADSHMHGSSRVGSVRFAC